MIQCNRAQPHGLARQMLYLETVSLRAAVLSGDSSEESLAGEGSGRSNHSISPQQGSASSRDMDPAVGWAMQIGISATPSPDGRWLGGP